MDSSDDPNTAREGDPHQREAQRPGTSRAHQGTSAGPRPNLSVTPDVLLATAEALEQLDWSHGGLSRDQIKKRYAQLSPAIYLRLPSTKHFASPAEVLHDVGDAQSRAEGEYLGANPDIPEAESIAEGGPPAWGGDPLYSIGGVEEGGSAEDTEGLIEDDES